MAGFGSDPFGTSAFGGSSTNQDYTADLHDYAGATDSYFRGGGGGPAPVDSFGEQVPGIIYRWRADDIVGLNSGDVVSSWTPRSGSVGILTASGTGRPTWQDDVANGMPVVRFNGTSNFMNYPTIPARSQPVTIIAVHKCNVIPPAGQWAELFDMLGNIQIIFGNTNMYDSWAGTIDLFGGTPNTQNFRVLIFQVNGASSNVWIDGLHVITNQNPGPNSLGGSLTIGRYDAWATRFAAMDLAELAILDHAITSGEVTATFDYATNVYGTEGGTAGQSLTASPADSATTTDAVGFVSSGGAFPADSATTTDAVTLLATNLRTMPDSITTTDSVSYFNGIIPIDYVKTASDAAAAHDHHFYQRGGIGVYSAALAAEPIGVARGWRYLAQRIYGDGTPGEWIDLELPLQNVQLTDVLSGPPQGSATISPQYHRLLDSRGNPILGEWSTVIYAEADGEIQPASGIVVHSDFDGPDWALEWSGFSGYAKGMGYEGTWELTDVDPLDIVRYIWQDIQTGQDSNLGLVIDTTTSPVRIGLPVPDPNTPEGQTPVMQPKPYVLAWWCTDDLGGEIDKLAKDTPFDYREWHWWDDEHLVVNHFLELGYPTLGRRRDDMRFVVGENLQTIPPASRQGDQFANHVRFLGAGEGSQMVWAESRVRDGRLRRMATVDDKSVTDTNRARINARSEMAARHNLTSIDQVLVRESPLAQLSELRPGDEIRVQSSDEWIRNFDRWLRVVQITRRPDEPELAQLTLQRPRDGVDQMWQAL